MKVEVKQNKSEHEQKFPCLMKSSRLKFVIYCTGIGREEHLLKGIVLNGNGTRGEGYYSDGWDRPSFQPFNGTVTLSND